MTIDYSLYQDREQAYVKHTFLDQYLPALFSRVGSVYDEIVYVDGFAGPWQSAAGKTFADTSFGIALRRMTEQKVNLGRNRGRSVKMRAFLVERDEQAFEELKKAASTFQDVEVHSLHGRMEDFAAVIANAIPGKAFSFVLIDPKGFPEIDAIMPLLSRRNSEALVNFMFDFANRFAGTELIPALGQWLSLLGGEDRQAQLVGLTGDVREQAIESMAAEALRTKGQYDFAPLISVDKVRHDRSLYKLIFLSRHATGLKVFRDSQHKALVAQATARSAVRAKDRAAAKGMDDLFGGADAVPHDRSSQVMKLGQEQAKRDLEAALRVAGIRGVTWIELWPAILSARVVTHSQLGHAANELRRAGKISIAEWPNERTRIPKDDFRLVWRV